MKTPQLQPQDVQVLAHLARSGEGIYLREKVLKPWLAIIDVDLRKADRNSFQAVQGNAQMLEHVIDLLTIHEPRGAKTRRLVVDGEARDVPLSARKPVDWAGTPS